MIHCVNVNVCGTEIQACFICDRCVWYGSTGVSPHEIVACVIQEREFDTSCDCFVYLTLS